MLKREILEKYYLTERKSSRQISVLLKCSEHKVNYWIDKYKIKKRSISDSLYVRCNPSGNPFELNKLLNKDKNFIYGLGLGLYLVKEIMMRQGGRVNGFNEDGAVIEIIF